MCKKAKCRVIASVETHKFTLKDGGTSLSSFYTTPPFSLTITLQLVTLLYCFVLFLAEGIFGSFLFTRPCCLPHKFLLIVLSCLSYLHSLESEHYLTLFGSASMCHSFLRLCRIFRRSPRHLDKTQKYKTFKRLHS